MANLNLFCIFTFRKSVDNTNSTEENVIDRIVVFPDGNEVQPKTGGCSTREEFTLQSLRLQNCNGSAEETLTSRPSREYARDNNDFFLEESFPMQFPFGIGGLNEERIVDVTREECLRHYLRIANPFMMQANFILTVHSMYEKDKALLKALLCCRSKTEASSMGVQVG